MAETETAPKLYQSWNCEHCGAAGVVEYRAREDAIEVMAKAKRQHFLYAHGRCEDQRIRFVTVPPLRVQLAPK